ncbi:hypothetical protein N7478_001744 [Penicillium angulare]|uniref:uncharacterized protein n=1 Tax=Penicillium angulare TaxID=116970 RepID=UPI0025417976|nr:uncharacterized protein N7478_001744 [Penicillium angulare]KAJ5288714.1 hypothetical protein N7478_001744 [Penicillium angulare]
MITTLARLNEDQQVYDSIRSFFVNFPSNDEIAHDTDIFEPVDYCINASHGAMIPFVATEMLILMTWLKIKLVLDLRRVEAAMTQLLALQIPSENRLPYYSSCASKLSPSSLSSPVEWHRLPRYDIQAFESN